MNVVFYRHPNPGYTCPLWLDGKPIKTKDGAGKSNAIFAMKGKGIDVCGIFHTDEEKVAKAIEQTKAFQKGNILRLQSAEDIKMESQRIEQEKFRVKTIGLVENGLFDFKALKNMKQKPLHGFAKDIGVPISTGKGVRKNEEILDDIEQILSFKESKKEDEE